MPTKSTHTQNPVGTNKETCPTYPKEEEMQATGRSRKTNKSNTEHLCELNNNKIEERDLIKQIVTGKEEGKRVFLVTTQSVG